LIQEGHSLSESDIFKEGGVLVDPGLRGGSVGVHGGNLDDVRTVSLVGSFSSITSRVSITSGPLEVDIVSYSNIQLLWGKVVFGGRISLHDISSLSSDVQVPNSCTGRNRSSRSALDVEDIRTILEGSSELGGVIANWR